MTPLKLCPFCKRGQRLIQTLDDRTTYGCGSVWANCMILIGDPTELCTNEAQRLFSVALAAFKTAVAEAATYRLHLNQKPLTYAACLACDGLGATTDSKSTTDNN